MVEELHSKTMLNILEKGNTPFDELRTSQRTPIIQINGSYETSELRDVIRTDSTATVTSEDSEFKLSLNATGDKALIATSNRGRYVPGYAAEAGVGVRLPELPTGDGEARWGYFDFESGTQNINDGAFFGADENGMFISIYRNGTEQSKIRKADWDNSTDIDLSNGYIFQIVFVYYGYGPVWFRLVDPETENIITLHKIIEYGTATFSNSNLQVAGQAITDITGDPFDFYISGRQFAVYGNPVFKIRIVSHLVEAKTIPTAEYVPVMSFRRKEDRRAVPIQIQELEAISNNDVLVQWRVDADISIDEGELSWITPSGHNEDEVSLEVNVDADNIDMNTGLKIDEDLILGGGGPSPRQLTEDENFSDVPDEYIVTLCAKALDTEATADVIGKMTEER